LRCLLYLGCHIPTKQYAYEISARKVLPALGVELMEFREAQCCGLPIKQASVEAWLYMASRILALAGSRGLPLLTLCNGCNTSLREAAHVLKTRPEIKEKMKEALREEGIALERMPKVRHTIEVLYDDVGVERIKQAATRSLKGLKVAAYYGCHLVRPRHYPRPVDPENPVKMEEIIEALGGSTGDYPDKLGCCGAMVLSFSAETAVKIAASKLKTISEMGFDLIVTSCPYCFEMLDSKQEVAKSISGEEFESIPVMYLTQLIGLCMGFKPEELGLYLNMSPVDEVLEKLGVS